MAWYKETDKVPRQLTIHFKSGRLKVCMPFLFKGVTAQENKIAIQHDDEIIEIQVKTDNAKSEVAAFTKSFSKITDIKETDQVSIYVKNKTKNSGAEFFLDVIDEKA